MAEFGRRELLAAAAVGGIYGVAQLSAREERRLPVGGGGGEAGGGGGGSKARLDWNEGRYNRGAYPAQ